MSAIFKTGDLVWAKMKGFSPWPGRVSLPTSDLKQPPKKNVAVQCIYFFGSNNFAWIEEPNIKPYQDFKEQLIKSCKTAAFKDAITQIEEYIINPEKFGNIDGHRPDPEEEFNKLKEALESDDNIRKSIEKPKKEKVVKRPSTTKISVPRKKPKNDLQHSYSHINDYDGEADTMLNHAFKKSSCTLLDRPANIIRPATPKLDLENITETLKGKNILPSQMKFGFLGLGIMGSGIVKNLLNSGHKVIVWNRTASKCQEFEKVGAKRAVTPCDVVEEADITFSCVADPQAAKEMVFGNCGVLHSGSLNSKGYVEMTSIDADTSHDIVDALSAKGARYLEAQIQGSKTQAEEGTLIILAAGDRSLFDDCQTCFEAMSKNSFYLGEIGNASKMNLVLQLINGVVLAGLAEGMALADRAGLKQKDLLEVLELTSLSCPTIMEKGRAMIDKTYPTHQPLSHLQKDLKLALGMGDMLELTMHLTATTNEIFKHAKRLGYSAHDASAVYIGARF